MENKKQNMRNILNFSEYEDFLFPKKRKSTSIVSFNKAKKAYKQRWKLFESQFNQLRGSYKHIYKCLKEWDCK